MFSPGKPRAAHTLYYLSSFRSNDYAYRIKLLKKFGLKIYNKEKENASENLCSIVKQQFNKYLHYTININFPYV